MVDLKTLLRLLSESPVEIRPYGKTSYYLDETRLIEKIAVRQLFDHLKPWCADKQEFKDMAMDIPVEDPVMGKRVITEVGKLCRKKDKEKAKENLGKLLKDHSFTHRNLVPVIDIITGDRALYDTNSEEVAPLNFDVWAENCAPTKEGREIEMSNKMLGFIKYNPFNIKSRRTRMYKGQEIYEFNSHVPPEWRKSDCPEDLKPHELWFRIMEHLFPNEDCREFVYHWIYTMLTTRNQTILTLVSVMGTGKGVLYEILEHLIGEHNSQKQSEGYFKSQFNNELRNKRLVGFDEVPILPKYKENFKFVLNNNITIESKGKNVEGTVKNHASIVVMNNQFTQNYLVSKDRRFSVPDITDTPMNEVIDDMEVEKFLMDLHNEPEIIRHIGHYILKYGKSDKYTEFSCYKNDKFYKLVVLSLTEWQRFVYNVVISKEKESYSFSDLKFEYEDATGSRKFPGEKTMQIFLDEFRDREGDLIADVDKIGRDFHVVPRAKYLPEEDFEDI